jgi:hypothetical protein
VDREGAMKRNESLLSDLVIRRRVELAAFRIIEEVVHGLVSPLGDAVVIARGSMIAHVGTLYAATDIFVVTLAVIRVTLAVIVLWQPSSTYGLIVDGDATIRGRRCMMMLVAAASMAS